MQGMIFDIQRFCLNDGPGIRTCIFLKGCPLRCLWCHNPESVSVRKALSYDERLCIHCGICTSVCECHMLSSQGMHEFNRASCSACGRCVEACPANALQLVGREATVEDILSEVRKDAAFYQQSGGGMTVSGGEPLAQPAFLKALLEAAKAEGLDTSVETCGHARWEDLEAILPLTDRFLFDIKETDPDRHRQFTGVDPALIQTNLRRLSDSGAQIVLRCPMIPGYNVRTEHLQRIGELAQSLSGVVRVEVEPYHPLGVRKAVNMGLKQQDEGIPIPTDETVSQWIAEIAKHTSKPVQKA